MLVHVKDAFVCALQLFRFGPAFIFFYVPSQVFTQSLGTYAFILFLWKPAYRTVGTQHGFCLVVVEVYSPGAGIRNQRLEQYGSVSILIFQICTTKK